MDKNSQVILILFFLKRVNGKKPEDMYTKSLKDIHICWRFFVVLKNLVLAFNHCKETDEQMKVSLLPS